MEQFLTKNNNKVDAVIAANDGTAGGAIAALAAQGLAGSVPVSGQDADKAALNRVALGTQTVTVFKDARELGRNAAEIAVQLAGGKKLSRDPGREAVEPRPEEAEHDGPLPHARSRSRRTTSTWSSMPAGSRRTWSARA